jgi:hypothetical protein
MQVSIASIKVAKFGHANMISSSFFFLMKSKFVIKKLFPSSLAFFLIMKIKGLSRAKIARWILKSQKISLVS